MSMKQMNYYDVAEKNRRKNNESGMSIEDNVQLRFTHLNSKNYERKNKN